MKTLIPLFFCLLFLLGCTETIYEEIFKTDTVYVSTPRTLTVTTETDTLVVTDTVEVRVVVREVDTVFQVVTKDSIIIKEVDKIVNHYDTIINTVTVTVHDTVETIVYDRTVIYQDTVYLVSGFIRPTTSIPLELIPLVLEYGELSGQYGKGSPRSEIIIQYMPESELPGDYWASFSFDFANQWIIYLSINVPVEQQRAGIFRELTHLNLNKKYSNDPNKIMSPIWSPSREINKADLDTLFN